MGREQSSEVSTGTDPARRTHPLYAGSLWCENCGTETPHRVLRTDPVRRDGSGSVQGTARCQVCRWTHRFESRPEGRVEVSQVVSVGGTSAHSRIELPAHVRVQVGSGVPGSGEPLRVQRIDTRDGRRVRAAQAEEVLTLWAVREVGAIVPVSIIEREQTRAARLVVPRETPYEVGGRLTIEGTPLDIVALRAKGATWRRKGDRFLAGEVQRIYGRRTVSPPAGRSDWRRGRGRPSSFESSTSRAPRSRSSPGARRTRTSPRARTADGGATVHRSSPS